MSTALKAREGYLAEFDRARPALGAADRGWLDEQRGLAIARFADLGFPAASNEDWKYTGVGPIVKAPFERVARDHVSFDAARVEAAVERAAGTGDATVLVFVDGHFVADLSRLDAVGEQAGGARLSSLLAAIENDHESLRGHLGKYLDSSAHGFAALNAAFVEDGAFVHIPRGMHHDRPIHLVFVSGPGGQGGESARRTMSHPRNVIVAEAGSTAQVVEHYVGGESGEYFTNAATEIYVGENAKVAHCKVQAESAGAFHVHRVQAYQERNASFASHAVALGAALSRTEIHTVLAAEGAECGLDGLYVLGGRQHADHHTTVDHAAPHTSSRELYKGIVDDRARGVFTGKVLVRRDAQQIEAEQTNKNLLLADGASVETRPQLEIYADDVKCSHGAAIGQLDEKALFYMRQRGLDERQARSLLTYGFGSEVLATLGDDELRARLEQAVLSRIGAAVSGPEGEGRS